MRAALAGAIAATVWGLQEPLDRRVFRCDYSDVRLVGGLPVHALNGAPFGLALAAVRRRTQIESPRLVVMAGLAEQPALRPLHRPFHTEIAAMPPASPTGTDRNASVRSG